jgi:hypothetical protein
MLMAGEGRGTICGQPRTILRTKVSALPSVMGFAVGIKVKGRTSHVLVDAEDALIAALKVKSESPDARIIYVRPQNRRGDARHPPLAMAEH